MSARDIKCNRIDICAPEKCQEDCGRAGSVILQALQALKEATMSIRTFAQQKATSGYGLISGCLHQFESCITACISAESEEHAMRTDEC